jgi:hypothetical protein
MLYMAIQQNTDLSCYAYSLSIDQKIIRLLLLLNNYILIAFITF